MSTMEAREMIAVYEELLALSARMLESARDGDWDGLVALEAECRSRVSRLRALGDAPPPLSPREDARKTDIVRRVLADDAEIRRLTEPWMNELEQMIGNARNQRRLLHSYGAGA